MYQTGPLFATGEISSIPNLSGSVGSVSTSSVIMGNHEAYTIEDLSGTASTSSVIMGNHEAYTIEDLSGTASTSSVIMGNHEKDNIAIIPPPSKVVESLFSDRIEPFAYLDLFYFLWRLFLN